MRVVLAKFRHEIERADVIRIFILVTPFLIFGSWWHQERLERIESLLQQVKEMGEFNGRE